MSGAGSGGNGGTLRIAAGLDAVLLGDNEVLVQFGSRSEPSRLLRDTDLTGLLGKVFAELHEGTSSRDELLARVAPEQRAEAGQLLDSLCDQGIVTTSETSPVDQYLDLVFTGRTRLDSRTVGVVGAGPLGSRIAETLLEHGIGGLRLLEPRPVGAAPATGDGHRVDRHDQWLRDRLVARGYSGVETVRTQAEPGNGHGELIKHLERMVAGTDLVALALERPDVRLAHLLNRVCVTQGKPWLHACLDGSRGIAGPLFVPGRTACYNDFRVLSDAATPSPVMARVYRERTVRQEAGDFPVGLPAHAVTLAGLVSLATVHQLTSESCFLLGRTFTIDFDRMLIDTEDVLKLPRCPVCGRHRNPYRPAFSVEVVSRARSDGHG